MQSPLSRCAPLSGNVGTAGRTTTPFECEWREPCPSPHRQPGSASTASSRPQRCEAETRMLTCRGHQVSPAWTEQEQCLQDSFTATTVCLSARGVFYFVIKIVSWMIHPHIYLSNVLYATLFSQGGCRK